MRLKLHTDEDQRAFAASKTQGGLLLLTGSDIINIVLAATLALFGFPCLGEVGGAVSV